MAKFLQVIVGLAALAALVSQDNLAAAQDKDGPMAVILLPQPIMGL